MHFLSRNQDLHEEDSKIIGGCLALPYIRRMSWIRCGQSKLYRSTSKDGVREFLRCLLESIQKELGVLLDLLVFPFLARV
jgi:hypothetical protein